MCRVLSVKTYCHFQFEFITLCFAVFAERILPINIAALSASKLHLDDLIKMKTKNANGMFLFGFLFRKVFIGKRRMAIFYWYLCVDAVLFSTSLSPSELRCCMKADLCILSNTLTCLAIFQQVLLQHAFLCRFIFLSVISFTVFFSGTDVFNQKMTQGSAAVSILLQFYVCEQDI